MLNHQTKIQNKTGKNVIRDLTGEWGGDVEFRCRGMCEDRTKTSLPVDKISAKSGRECYGDGCMCVYEGGVSELWRLDKVGFDCCLVCFSAVACSAVVGVDLFILFVTFIPPFCVVYPRVALSFCSFE